MKPFVVRYKGDEEDMLCVGFAAPATIVFAVVVMRDGTMGLLPVEGLRVEFGSQDFPLGPGDWAFSRMMFERQPA